MIDCDITKCSNEDCSMKETCWRFKAPANPYRQSYFCPDELSQHNGCDEYWPIEKDVIERV